MKPKHVAASGCDVTCSSPGVPSSPKQALKIDFEPQVFKGFMEDGTAVDELMNKAVA